jgi:transketolase N-terminal domain/subunit
MGNLDVYAAVARQLRADSIRSPMAAGSGHPTSSLSAADLMAVLLVGHLRYDWAEPKNPTNDHLNLQQRPRLAAQLRAFPRRRCNHRPGSHDVP